jgi:hypothetical protein
MTVTLIFVVVAGLGLAFFILRIWGGRLESVDEATLGERLRPVDLEAFRNLIDPAEEQFLRDHLPPAEFQAIQRERLRAATDYTAGVLHNAGILLQLGQAGRSSPDPRVADAARHLVDNAVRLRFYSLLAITKLQVRIAFPGTGLEPTGIVPHYQQMSEWAALLARLQHPGKSVLISRN